MKYFGTVRQKLRRKLVILPPSLIQIFSVPKNIATVKDSPTEIFGTVRQKMFDRKCWNSPPPLIHKLFRYRNFSETQLRRVHLPNFSVLWEKNISIENWKSWHNPLKLKISRCPKLMKHWRIPPTEIFGTLRPKIFDGKSSYPLPPLWCRKFFATWNFPIHRSVPQRNFSVLWDKKFWMKSRA